MKVLTTLLAVAALASPSAHSQTLSYSVAGEDWYANFGISLDAVPDIDGDGADEILVGAPGARGAYGRTGVVSVLSGRTGLLLQSIGGIPRHTPSTLAFPGRERRRDHGSMVRCIGDVDGDARADYAIGSPLETATLGRYRAGRVHVHSGATGTRLFSVDGRTSYAQFGKAIDEVGDLNGDGYADLIIGSYRHTRASSTGGLYSAGLASVISGRDGTSLFEIEGQDAYTFLGRQVAGLGDVDLDGVRDFAILVASPGGVTGSGLPVVRVHSGATGLLVYELAAADLSTTAPLGFSFGKTIARSGDLDGDGTDDFVIGDPGAFLSGVFRGVVLVVSGRTGQLIRLHTGSAQTDQFGASVRATSDLDGDGVTDIVVADPGYRVPTQGGWHYQGQVSGYSGADGSTLFEKVGLPGTSLFSRGLAVGDFSGDGIIDFAGGGPVTNSPLLQSGRVDVYTR